jgi:hypothetical protein
MKTLGVFAAGFVSGIVFVKFLLGCLLRSHDCNRMGGLTMPIKWPQTRQDAIEVAEWIAGTGPVTRAVQEATVRYGVTFGAALITRKHSEGFARN